MAALRPARYQTKVRRRLESFLLEPGGTWAENLVAAGPFVTSSVTNAGGWAIVTASDGGTLSMWWEAVDQPGWTKEIVALGDSDDYYSGGSVTTLELRLGPDCLDYRL